MKSASAGLVLGISGSPRKDGNTDVVVKRTLRIIEELKDVKTVFLRVADFNIAHCRGCRECMRIGECAIKDDDFNLILDKLMKAQLIVIGAPVFWNSPPGVMKDFIDRTHGFYTDRKRLIGKKVGIISVATSSGFESHEDVLSWLTVYGAEIAAKVRLYAREKGEVLGKAGEMTKIEDFSRTLADGL